MEGRISSLMKYVNRTIFRRVVQSKISLNGLSSTIFYPERVPDYVIEHFPDGEWQKSFEKDSILEKERDRCTVWESPDCCFLAALANWRGDDALEWFSADLPKNIQVVDGFDESPMPIDTVSAYSKDDSKFTGSEASEVDRIVNALALMNLLRRGPIWNKRRSCCESRSKRRSSEATWHLHMNFRFAGFVSTFGSLVEAYGPACFLCDEPCLCFYRL